MWLSKRERREERQGSGAEEGTVTVAESTVGVYAQGERRGLRVYGPGGYCWRPQVGDQVLVVKTGEEGEGLCVAGTEMETIQPGEVKISAPGGASILLNRQGGIQITGGKISLVGDVYINGELYRPCRCAVDVNTQEE